MDSGSVFSSWSLMEDPEQRALRFGRLLGFMGTDVNLLVDFLRTKPFSDLIVAQRSMIDYENLNMCLEFPFTPCVEKEGTGNVTFLSVHPNTVMQNGEFSRLPIMIGTCTNEGALVLQEAYKKATSYGFEYNRFIPDDLGLKNDSVEFQQLENDINEFYYHNQPIDKDHLDEYTEVCSDIVLNNAIHKSLTYFSKWNVKTHLYVFAYDGRYGSLKNYIKRTRSDIKKFSMGPYHSDILGYIFRRNQKYYIDSDSVDMKTIRQISSYWANFTKYGNPNGIDKENTIWKPYSKNNIRYLEINGTNRMVNHIFVPERLAFWQNIYDKYKKN